MSKKNKKSPNWMFVSSKYNIILFVLLLIVNVSVAYVMRGLTSFSNLSKTLFIVINVIALLVLLILDVIFIVNLKSKKSNIYKGLLVASIVFVAIGGYGSFAMFKVNKNVNKIITSEKQTETVETSIVVNNGMYLDISDLDGKSIGIVTGTTNAELGKSHIDAKCNNVNYIDYSDINSLFTALVANEIDAAVLPSNYKGIFEVVDGYEEALENTEAIDTFSEKVTVEVSKSDKDITSEPFSVLVLGVDEGRSDANMVVTFNPISLEITMTSIARDSYVPIACYAGKSSDKLGHAHVQGIQCTIDTIEDLLDIEIDYYFESNFAGVVSIVDALGGIIISNPYEFVGQNSSDQRGHYTVWVPAGENIPVNGEQALAFARERHLYASGDFQRQANQQQVITSILKRAMETRDLNKLLSVLDAAGDNIKTNISVDELIDLFNYVMEKTKRYYGTENIETMFKIVGSRVTGYNSSVWSEASQLALSIVRPYEGSIKDNNAAINRNLNLNSEITADKYFYWEANSEFYAPTISNETYSEKIIQAETPQSYWCNKTGGSWDGYACACPVGDFVENKGCSETIASDYYDAGSCIGAGFIWNEQNNTCVNTCPEGYTSDGQYCKLVKQAASEYKTKDACIAVGYKWDETNGTGTCVESCKYGDNNGVCKKDDSATTYSLIIRYIKEDGSEAAPSYTTNLKEGDSYSVTSPTVSGYTADTTVVSGTMKNAPVDLTVKYKKNASESTPIPTPTPTPTPPTEEPTPTPTSTPEPTPVPPTSTPEPTPTPACGANAHFDGSSCVCDNGFEGDPNSVCNAITQPPATTDPGTGNGETSEPQGENDLEVSE